MLAYHRTAQCTSGPKRSHATLLTTVSRSIACRPGGCIPTKSINGCCPTQRLRAAWIRDNIPAGYIGEPTDFAPLVTFLASPRARFITGQVIHIDGGARRYAH